MKKNDLFELTITDMGTEGEGIGKYDGMTFFVKDAYMGDVILAKAMKLKKNYGYARVEKILEASPHRVEPLCPNHRRCGGCQMQALSYEAQLAFKERKVLENLVRIGGFEKEDMEGKMLPIVGMDEPYRYRNKAQFPVGTDKEGNIVSGFYAARTHQIIPVEDCFLGVSQNRLVQKIVTDWMEENKILPYDEASGRGLSRHILVRYGFDSKEIMVCLIINGERLPAKDGLLAKLCEIPGMTSVSININQKNTNVILGEKTECIWGKSYITDSIYLRDTKADFARTKDFVSFRISPKSFYQVNPMQTEKLYSTALEYAGLTGRESVWDLYCGIGTISLFLAKHAKMVYGVEIVPEAIADAKANAELNGITNAKFFVGKAEEVLPEFYERESADMKHPNVIVVDPPRKGCDEKCLETMQKMAPNRIVYVSCDSATLARDLKYLCEHGYEIKKVRAFDQFAHTGHVETAVLLMRAAGKEKKEINYREEEIPDCACIYG